MKSRAASREPSAESRTVLCIAVTVFVLVRAPTAQIPLDRDEGGYAYTAQRMLRGEALYRDAYDHKPPGIFLIYLLPVSLFGTSPVGIHLTLYAWTLATGAVLYVLARRVIGLQAAAFAALIFAMVSAEPTHFATAAVTEPFMLLPMCCAVLFGLRARDEDSRRGWFLAGAVLMAACWIKPVAAINAPLLAALGIKHERRGAAALKVRRTLGNWAALTAGVLTLAAPVCLGFAVAGLWREFVDANWTYSLRYVSRLSVREGLGLIGTQLAYQAGSLWLVWLLAGVGLVARQHSSGAHAIMAAWLALSACAVTVGQQFYAHYFVQLAPALSLAAGAGLAAAAGWLVSGRSARARAVVCAVMALLGVTPMLVRHRRFLYASSPRQQSVVLYGINPFDVSEEIGRYVASRTDAADRVLIFGSEPQILFAARRRSATRYIYFYPLMLDPIEGLERQKAAWREIEQSRPRCVLMTEVKESLLEQPNSPTLLRDKVAHLLDGGYVIEGVRTLEPDEDSVRSRLLFGNDARNFFNRIRVLRQPGYLDMIILIRP